MPRGLINDSALTLASADVHSQVVTTYRDAAKVNGTQSVTGQGRVTVFNVPNSMKAGDTLSLTQSGLEGTSTVKICTCLGINSQSLSIDVGNFRDENGGVLASISFTGNQYLLPTNDKPALSSDLAGNAPVTNPFTIAVGHVTGLTQDAYYVPFDKGEQYYVTVVGTTFKPSVNPVLALVDSRQTVASATAIVLPEGETNIIISGTADINYIYPNRTGQLREVTLVFSGTKATNGMVDGLNLKLASTLAYTPDDSITLRCDGTNWIEIARSVN